MPPHNFHPLPTQPQPSYNWQAPNNTMPRNIQNWNPHNPATTHSGQSWNPGNQAPQSTTAQWQPPSSFYGTENATQPPSNYGMPNSNMPSYHQASAQVTNTQAWQGQQNSEKWSDYKPSGFTGLNRETESSYQNDDRKNDSWNDNSQSQSRSWNQHQGQPPSWNDQPDWRSTL